MSITTRPFIACGTRCTPMHRTPSCPTPRIFTRQWRSYCRRCCKAFKLFRTGRTRTLINIEIHTMRGECANQQPSCHFFQFFMRRRTDTNAQVISVRNGLVDASHHQSFRSQAMAQPANIFSDLEVVDLASHIAGPVAKTTLSDFGVSDIKVPLETGGPHRHFLCDATEPYLRAHPRARNALTPDMISEASDTLDLVASNELVHAIALAAAAFVEEHMPNFGSRRACH